MKHNGKYSCLASNMAGDTELTFNVEIQGLFYIVIIYLFS
jgi:hypothetical protein